MKSGLTESVLAYVRRVELLRAGDRVALAVSGGADSVALLRLMLELGGELGIVLSVVHFNHRIRGAEADCDEQFVAELARAHGLEFYCASGDVPAHAKSHQISLETAARELRYEYFRQVLGSGVANKLATAHTLDDQAETVLLRLLRGAGTKGLAGIHPQWSVNSSQWPEEQRPVSSFKFQVQVSAENRSANLGHPPSARDDNQKTSKAIVRPLLGVSRKEVEQYLLAVGQQWREDATNRDVSYPRNRVRHVLLPMLEREFNPAIRQVLAETAEVARAEEAYWDEAVQPYRAAMLDETSGVSECTVDVKELSKLPLALQRRWLRAMAQETGLRPSFSDVERILALARARVGAKVELPGGWVVERRISNSTSGIEAPNPTSAKSGLEWGPRPVLSFRQVGAGSGAAGYEYCLQVPGEVAVAELGIVLRASRLRGGAAWAGYNHEQLLDARSIGSELRIRNWHPGDRFWPLHTKSPKKIKELLQRRRIAGNQRALWPVAVKTGAPEQVVVWIHGFPVAEPFAVEHNSEEAVVLQVVALKEKNTD